MTLRYRLILLVAATLAPMAVCAVFAAVLLMQQERAVVERDAIGRARSAMSAVDAHLRGTILALRTLGMSKNLESGNLAAFHAETQRALEGDPAWVNITLMAPTREVLTNAVYAYGRPELPPPQNDSLKATANGTKVAIGDVRSGNVVRNPTVRVNVPVVVRGEAGYVLVAPMNMKQIAEVLQAQTLPESWTISLVDREKHVIAALPPVPTGADVADGLRKAIAQNPEGWTRIDATEATVAHTAHVTSELSGWILAIGVPEGYVETGARRSLAILLLGLLLSLAVGTIHAWRMTLSP
jgi:hypothetical protein